MFFGVYNGLLSPCSPVPVAGTADNAAYDAPCWRLSVGAVLHYLSQCVCKELAKFNLNMIYSTSSPRVELGATQRP